MAMAMVMAMAMAVTDLLSSASRGYSKLGLQCAVRVYKSSHVAWGGCLTPVGYLLLAPTSVFDLDSPLQEHSEILREVGPRQICHESSEGSLMATTCYESPVRELLECMVGYLACIDLW